jgi:hypothetical protein
MVQLKLTFRDGSTGIMPTEYTDNESAARACRARGWIIDAEYAELVSAGALVCSLPPIRLAPTVIELITLGVIPVY